MLPCSSMNRSATRPERLGVRTEVPLYRSEDRVRHPPSGLLNTAIFLGPILPQILERRAPSLLPARQRLQSEGAGPSLESGALRYELQGPESRKGLLPVLATVVEIQG